MISPQRKTICIAILAALFTVAASSSFSQTNQDATPILQTAIEKNREADNAETRFTYDLLEHSQNFNQKGEILHEVTRRYEVIYIADLLYQHLLEVNGKPLAGQDLADEQKRYDDTIRERYGLDAATRAKLINSRHIGVSTRLGQILTKYRSKVVGPAVLNGRSCLMIDSYPLATVADASKRHLRIWLDPQQNQFLRIDFDLLADEEGPLRGSTGSMIFTYIDGVPLDTLDHLDFILPAKDKKKGSARMVNDQIFSNYQRFASTSQIMPAEKASTQQ
jgi:hypothetical protein